MSRRLRITSWFVPLALFLLVPFFAYAQEASSQVASSQDAGSPVSVTGCLKQGAEKKGYYLTTKDGKIYELIGKASTFSPHIGHTMTVTGKVVKLPDAQEAKLEPHEKTEAGAGTYIDVQVSDLKMVSASCTP